MATSSLRRQMKNMVHNYSDAEVKVREATSNDPWGPSATLMSEIAQLTHNPQTYSEVMMMIWKRLNDSGKYWRHVYKSLNLMDYLIKNGSNKVVQECKENIAAVQTLKDFQFFDTEGRDQGINVREKSKVIVALLKDDEKIKQERAQAQTTRRRMSQVTAAIDSKHRIRFNEGSDSSTPSTEIEQARPQSSGEEELQLQLALAMSREEADKKKEPSAPDQEEEIQLQEAINKSKEEYEKEMRSHQGEISIIQRALMETQLTKEQAEQETEKKKETHLADLIDIFGPPQPSTTDAWNSQHASPFPAANANPMFAAWGLTDKSSSKSTSSLPWDTSRSTQLRAENASQSIIFSCDSSPGWEEPQISRSLPSDPWGDQQKGGNEPIYDVFAPLSPTRDAQSPSSVKTNNSLELDFFGDSEFSSKPAMHSPDHLDLKPRSKTPETFLEPAARTLVNLESLISYGATTVKPKNPFAPGVSAPSASNPFQHGDLRPSLNQMKAVSPVPNNNSSLPPGLLPTNTMETGINTLPTVTPFPGFPLLSSAPMPLLETGMNPLPTMPPMSGFPVLAGTPMPLQPYPTAVPPYASMGYPYAMLPIPLTQPTGPAPSSQEAGTNPFL